MALKPLSISRKMAARQLTICDAMNQNYDQEELSKFAALAAHWWDTEGELKTLHQINPIRLCYISDIVSLSGKTVMDVGCGGGILAESMSFEGAKVTGIDMNKSVIEVAKLHQLESASTVEYLHISTEAIAAEREAQYDVVTCLEMLEHVPDPCSIVQACARLVKPGGHVFFSTLNRNPKSWLFAILGAEYLLKLLPKNTHDYAKFIRPSELSTWVREAGLTPRGVKGMSYNPFSQTVKLTADVSVNYLYHATRS
jgi:2-polyprenyl-6-hydroxyphenyl methylase/3-demethylubiquinone-9 3-methyltransferase